MLEASLLPGDGWNGSLQSAIIDKEIDGRRTIESVDGVLHWQDEEASSATTPPIIRVNLSEECTVDSIIINSNAKFIELYINGGYISTLKGYNSEEEKHSFECSHDQRLPNVKLIEFKFLSLKPTNKELKMSRASIDISPRSVNDAAHAAAPTPADIIFNFKKFEEIGHKGDDKAGSSASFLASMLQNTLNGRITDKTSPTPTTEAAKTTNMGIIDNNYPTVIEKMIDMKLRPVVEQLGRIEQMQIEILKKLNV